MADEDEVLPDDEVIEHGPEGEGAEGQDTGEGHDDGEVSAERADAPSGEDDGPPGTRTEGGDERPVSRGGNRFQRLSNDNAALREELAAARREREADRQARQAQEQQWTDQQWAERWNVMTPEEKINEAWSRGQQQLQGMQQQMRIQLQLMSDKNNWDASTRTSPVRAKYTDRVEDEFNRLLASNQFMPRERLYHIMLGQEADRTAASSTQRARRQGQKKIEAHTTRPTSNKGDASSQRGKAGDSAERRLAGVEI